MSDVEFSRITINWNNLFDCCHANRFYDIWRHIGLSAAILNYPAEKVLIKIKISEQLQLSQS